MSNYIVDECFRAEVEKHLWHRRGPYYRRSRWEGGRSVKQPLHHFVWLLSGRTLPAAPLSIDHANGDQSDNRIENLRVATKRLQSLNRKWAQKATGLPRGVHFDRRNRSRPYHADIRISGIARFLGYFATPEEASAAYEAELARQIEIEETRAKELMNV